MVNGISSGSILSRFKTCEEDIKTKGINELMGRMISLGVLHPLSIA